MFKVGVCSTTHQKKVDFKAGFIRSMSMLVIGMSLLTLIAWLAGLVLH